MPIFSRSKAIAEQRTKLRDKFFPDLDPKTLLWDRKAPTTKGFATIPRPLPMMLRIMDAFTPGKPVSSTYFGLWCRGFDEHFVRLDKPQELAFEAGFGGQRAIQTWGGRVDLLAELGFIRLAPGASGPRSFALLLNPYDVLKSLERREECRNDKEKVALFNALRGRASEVGANDLDAQDPPPAIPSESIASTVPRTLRIAHPRNGTAKKASTTTARRSARAST